MSKRKGLSFDEKREKLLELFAETSEFFTLKELEKIAPKRKGITAQTVKEVLQSLVDDDAVNSDKCGVQTVFWCLPSERVQKRRNRLAALDDSLREQRARRAALAERHAAARVGREASAARESVLAELASLQARLAEQRARVRQLADCDPAYLTSLERATDTCRAGANRWTDNLYCVRSYVKNTMGVELDAFDKAFDTAAHLQYME